jgi:hypothetical protein
MFVVTRIVKPGREPEIRRNALAERKRRSAWLRHGSMRALADNPSVGTAKMAASGSEEESMTGPTGAAAVHHWTRRVLGSISGLVLATGVLGTAISTYFQERSWTYQKRADKIDKDAAAAMAALDSLNKIVDEKFLSTFGLDDAIKNRAEGDKLDDAVKRFYAADKLWEQQHQALASTLEIVIDSQFGVDDLGSAALAKAVDCKHYTLDGLERSGADALPVRALLEIAYSCHTKLKQSIESQLHAREDNRGAWPATASEPDPGRVMLGHVWRVNNVLQCMMVQRAVEIRSQPLGASLFPFGQPGNAAAPYAASDADRAREQRCVEPYRSDPAFGISSLKAQ